MSRADRTALRILASRAMPALFAVGDWVFGGLIAVNLVLLAALIDVGPVDNAILVSITALGCALPLDVAGITLLRLVKDMNDAGFEDLIMQSYKEAGYPGIEAFAQSRSETEEWRRKRAVLSVWYASAIAAVGMVLTITGVVAALWHMAWWIGVVVLCVGLLSPILVVLMLVQAQPSRSEAEAEQKARYADIRSRQRRR